MSGYRDDTLVSDQLIRRRFLVESGQTVVADTLVMAIPGSSYAGIRPMADSSGGYQVIGVVTEGVTGDGTKTAEVIINPVLWCYYDYTATTLGIGSTVYAYQVSSARNEVKAAADASNDVKIGKIVGLPSSASKTIAADGMCQVKVESHFAVEHDTDTDTDTDTWATDNYNPDLAVRTIAEAGDIDIIPAADHERALELVSGSLQLYEVPDSSTDTITGVLKRGSDDEEMTDVLTFTEGTDGLWGIKDFTPTANVAVAADEKVYLTLGGTSSTAGAIKPLLTFKTTDAPS
jgi:hypothetical protein